MIEIVTRNGYILKYKGNIKLELYEPFLCIEAIGIYSSDPDDLIIWDSKVFDKIYSQDVISITGK